MIEPGTTITVEYGNGRMIDVRVMTGSKQTLLSKMLAKAAASEGSQDIVGMFEASKECLNLCVGEEIADAMWDGHCDAEMAMEIAGKTLGKQALSDDDKKKLESQRLSDSGSSAGHAETNARATISVV